MTWSIQPARTAFAGFASTWDRLNRELYNDHPMFDSRFIGALLTFFAQGNEYLCTHHDAGTCDGALILHPIGFGRWSLFLPAQAQAGALLLRDAGLLASLMPTLPGYAWSIDLLAIDPAYAPDWRTLTLPRSQSAHNLTMTVDVDGDFETYWQERPSQLRKNVRRYQRRSEEQFAGADLRLIQELEEIDAAVVSYGELESMGWKGKSGTAIGTDNLQGRFYRQLMRDFAVNNMARVFELHLGAKLAASRLIIGHSSMWIILKTTYDETLSAAAPGRLLLWETLKHAFVKLTNGSVEFYTNASRDQAEWATRLRHIAHHQIFRNEVVALLFGVGKSWRKRKPAPPFSPTTPPTPPSQYDPRTVRQYARPDELPMPAQTLWAEAGQTDFQLSSSWFSVLQNTVYQTETNVRFYLSEFKDTPTAILPLRFDHPQQSIESLANFYSSIYSPIFAPEADPLDLQYLLQAAIDEHGNASTCHFRPMDPDSPSYTALLTALRSIGWLPFRYFCFGNWYLPVDRPWAEYLQQRDGALRNTIKRKGRKFATAGGRFKIIQTPTEAEAAIPIFESLYRKRWGKNEPFPDFIPGLVRWLSSVGNLRLGIAYLGEIPVAAQLWVVSHGRASIFKLAYDEEFSSFAPGTLLTAQLMEQVLDHDLVKEVDYLVGDDPYKNTWMSHRRERWGIVSYNPRTLVGGRLLIRETIGRIIHRLSPEKHGPT